MCPNLLLDIEVFDFSLVQTLFKHTCRLLDFVHIGFFLCVCPGSENNFVMLLISLFFLVNFLKQIVGMEMLGCRECK